MAINPTEDAVRDPSRRRLYQANQQAKADRGELDPIDVSKLPKLFESTEARDSFKKDITDQTQTFLDANLQRVKERAVSEGRFDTGLTSLDEKIKVAEAGASLGTTLANLEFTERQSTADRIQQLLLQREGARNDQTLTRTQGQETRLNIGAQSDADIRSIGATGDQTRQNIYAQGGVDVANIRAGGTETRSNITAQSVADQLLQELVSTGRLSEIDAQGIQQRLNIQAQGAQDRTNLAQSGEQQIRQIQEEGRINTALQQLLGEQRIKEIEASGNINIDAIREEAKAELEAIKQRSIEDRLTQDDRLKVEQALAKLQTDTQMNIAELSAQTDKSIAQLSAENNIDVATISQGVELAKIASNEKIQSRLANVEERRTALAEKDQEAIENINLQRLALDQRAQEFGFKVTESQVTGVWEQYGPAELDAFNASFNKSKGQAGYNPRYDFDGDGNVNFADFIRFVELSKNGGVKTLDYQKFNEASRQFDLSRADQLTQWQQNFNELTRQYNLTQKQEFDLQVMALDSNASIAEANINVTEVGYLVQMLSREAESLLTDDDRNYIIDTILYRGDVRDAIDRTFGNTANNTVSDADNAVQQYNQNNSGGGIPGQSGELTSEANQRSLDRLKGAFGSSVGQDNFSDLSDLNKDNKIDFKDFTQLAANAQKVPNISGASVSGKANFIDAQIQYGSFYKSEYNDPITKSTDWFENLINSFDFLPDSLKKMFADNVDIDGDGIVSYIDMDLYMAYRY